MHVLAQAQWSVHKKVTAWLLRTIFIHKVSQKNFEKSYHFSATQLQLCAILLHIRKC